MGSGFVIMQIGDPELDRVYDEVLAPSMTECGLEPRRVDRDNEGGLLKAEIMAMIEESEIIVADLTNERPNCYLEVGYAMGLGKNHNLILTVRQDHLADHPDHQPGGPRVHFDLAGYDLLLWDPRDLGTFLEELTARIRRRQRIVEKSHAVVVEPDIGAQPWYLDLRQAGQEKIEQLVGRGVFELRFELAFPKVDLPQRDLLDAAGDAMVRTFGWPIGIVLDRNEYRPRPTGSGIRAEVEFRRGDGAPSYDLWELRTNGDFFLIRNLFEDARGRTDELFFNTRIVQVTESILYASRLYDRLGVDRVTQVNLAIRHSGLAGRELSAVTNQRHISPGHKSAVDESEVSVSFVLGDVDARLPELTATICRPLFELFDFFQLNGTVYREIVDRFVVGEVT